MCNPRCLPRRPIVERRAGTALCSRSHHSGLIRGGICMRLNRLLGVASNPEPAEGHRAGAGVVRVLSVAAVAVAACALSALPAMAASGAPAAAPGSVATTTTVTNPSYIDTEQRGVTATLTATVTATDGTTPTGRVTVAPTNRLGGIPANLGFPATAGGAGGAACTGTPALGS